MKFQTWLILLIFVFWLLAPSLTLAVEMQYPAIPGAETPQDFMAKIQNGQYRPEQAPGLFVRYFLYLAFWSVGLVALGAAVAAGFLYLVSGANPVQLLEAKDRLISAFLGLVLLLSSFLLISALNPDLLILRLPALPTVSPVAIPNPVLPTIEGAVFWEIPLATLTQKVVSLMPGAEAPAQFLKEKINVLKIKEDELVNLLRTCDCGNLSSNCSGASCAPLACTGTDIELCPNRSAIESKKTEVLAAASAVKTGRRQVLAAKFELEKETTRLATAESMLKNCPHSPLDRQAFLGLKEIAKIEIKKPWEEIDAENSPLTFYCEANDQSFDFMVANWEEHVANLEAELELDPDDIPDVPIESPVCGNSVCELGESHFTCSIDCPDAPEEGEESTPLDWPMANTWVIAPLGYSAEYFGCTKNHEGMDLKSSTGNTTIYAPANGEVIATGDLSNSCPIYNGAYGVWMAIKHRVKQGSTTFEFVTLYGHLSQILVSSGPVERGEPIAIMGSTGNSTGPHLHFGLYYNFRVGHIPSCGTADYPIGARQNPVPYMRAGAAGGHVIGTPCP